MRVVVTGGTGLLGSDLCRSLQSKHSLFPWARGRITPLGAAIPFDPVDVTDELLVRKKIERLKPEAVIHCAAMSDVDACERDPQMARKINRDGTAAVAQACSSVGAFLIAVSTDYVFDGELDRPYLEEDEPNPISEYAHSKLEGEEEALQSSPRCLVVRVSGLFGSGRTNFVSQAAQKFKTAQRVPVVTDQLNSPSYTADLAEGISLLLDRFADRPDSANPGGELHGILHLANAGGATRLEVAQRIAATLGASPSLIDRTTWTALNRPAKRPANSRLDCGRFARTSGRGLRGWEEALQAFLSRA